MHVLIEALSTRVGGGVTRLVGTTQSLIRVAPQHQYSIVLAPSYQRGIIDSLPRAFNVIPVSVPETNLLARSWFQTAGLSRLAETIGADVIFAASEGAYLRSSRPLVMMCGNLKLIREPGRRAVGLAAMMRRPFVRRSFAVAERIAFVSATIMHAAANDIGFADGKGFVVPHGVEPAFHPLPGSESRSDYYLAVSSIYPHKGYLVLLEAYSRLPESFPRLKIAGSFVDHGTVEAMRAFIKERRLGSRVELLGAVAFADLPDLYRRARGFVFPSEVESFGLPLVEAMASGTPVIASDIPVCHEVCADAALYFRPGDSRDLADRLYELENDVEIQQRLTTLGIDVAARFTWEASAQILIESLEAVAARSKIS